MPILQRTTNNHDNNRTATVLQVDTTASLRNSSTSWTCTNGRDEDGIANTTCVVDTEAPATAAPGGIIRSPATTTTANADDDIPVGVSTQDSGLVPLPGLSCFGW